MNLENPGKNQFLSFTNISSSNDTRGRASQWEMHSFGIAKSVIFSKFSQVSVIKLQDKTKKENFVKFSKNI